MMVDSGGPELPTVGLFSNRRRNYIIFLLFLVFTINFVDRQVIVILAEPIKDEFHLKDWQLGVITGLAFAILYSVLSVPVARLADRGNRAWVISGSLAVWSFFTIACGLTHTYAQLAAARLFVGVGEAGGSPPAHSLITDITPRKNWAKAIAFYTLGVPVGSLIGMVLGGLVTDGYGWRTAFFFAGAPGLVLAVIAFLTLKEPRKLLRLAPAPAPPLAAAIRVMAAKRSFVLLNVAGGLVTFVNYGQTAFFPSFFKRVHGADLTLLASSVNGTLHVHLGPVGFLGVTLGLTGALGGISGTLAGGWITDWATKREIGAFVQIALVGALVRIPLLILTVLAPRADVALALATLQVFFSGVMGAPSYTSIQALVAPRMRATASAIFHFFLNAVGLGLGPTCIGLLSDKLGATLGPAEGLRWAFIFSEAILAMAAVLLFFAIPFFRKEAYVQAFEPDERIADGVELHAAV
jgi:MFS family permease